MARITYHSRRRNTLNLMVLALAALGLITAVGANVAGLNIRRSSADTIRYLAKQGTTPSIMSMSPLSVKPCSGNWNLTECFLVKNISKQNVTLKYFLDCWDHAFCTDETKTIILTPNQEVSLGLGKPCSKWQLDLNISGQPGWDWGAIVEKAADCGGGAPNCNFVDIKVQP